MISEKAVEAAARVYANGTCANFDDCEIVHGECGCRVEARKSIEAALPHLSVLSLQDDAAIRSDAIRTTAEGMKKFAPDLMAEFVARWNHAKLSPDEKLQRFLDVLSEPRGAHIAEKDGGKR